MTLASVIRPVIGPLKWNNPALFLYNERKGMAGGAEMSIPKEALEQLINRLSEENCKIAYRFLYSLLQQQNPDDDPDYLTPEELEAVEKARREKENGQLLDWEDVQRELGL